MSRLDGLKRFVGQRLTAAVDEIFGHFERTISEFEEELRLRHRKLLEAEFPADVCQVPPEQQDWGTCPDQEDPEAPLIKEEQEDLWTSQDGDQLQRLEHVKQKDDDDDDDEDKPQSSQLHQTERMEVESDEEDCGGPEPARNAGPVSENKCSGCSEAGTEADDEDRRGSRSNLVPMSEDSGLAVKRSFVCCDCGRTFGRKDSLRRHARFHTGEKPHGCSVCGKRFSQRPNLLRHLRCHSGEKPFSCSFCHAGFAERSALVNHMRIHTGEKPFSCSYCDKRFTQKGGLKKHMTVHTGEKPYRCPVCDKSFSQKANLTYHFSVHTGQKQFGCRVCEKRFTWQSQVKSHKCVGEAARLSGDIH